MLENNAEKKLQAGCETLGLALSEKKQKALLKHLLLIQQWNKAYNLTAITNLEEMILKHVLDSLTVLPYLSGESWLDVGTGAGFPAIPLAIVAPEKKFILVDPNQKKTRFLEITRIRLGLNNVEIFSGRIQDLPESYQMDGIISRAFTNVKHLYNLVKKNLKENSSLYMMTGQAPTNELDDLFESVKVEIQPLSIPFSDAERHLVIVKSKK